MTSTWERPEMVGEVVALATAVLAGDAACLASLLGALELDPAQRGTDVALAATRCLVSALRLLVDDDPDAIQSVLSALALRAAQVEVGATITHPRTGHG
jgi:hypothetical protein